MSQTPLPLARELQSVIFALERELERLDIIGAGIAAIHVNAAIEHLRGNLDIVNDNCKGDFDPGLLRQIPDARRRIAQAFRFPKD